MKLSSKINVELCEETLLIPKSKKKLSLGIPSEDFKSEKRIALSPFAVKCLVDNGIDVLIEKGAGIASGFDDIEYSEIGARIAEQQKEVFVADILLKVAPPTKEQRSWLKKGQMIISALNLKTLEKEYFEDLKQKKVTAVALEYLQDETGATSVVDLMNTISGQVAINIAVKHLSEEKGKLLGSVPGNKPAEITILGAGSAALSAAQQALSMAAVVKLFDQSVSKIKYIEDKLSSKIFTSVPHESILKKELRRSDVVIGALSEDQIRSGFYISEDIIKTMKPGALVIDLNVDYASCFETSSLTCMDSQSFEKHGVTHYGIPNLPSLVPRTSSYALGNILLQYFVKFYEYNKVDAILKNNSAFRTGIYLYNGFFVKKQIADIYKYPCQDIDLILAAF